jgi:polysaccharide biosynthesis/export protein
MSTTPDRPPRHRRPRFAAAASAWLGLLGVLLVGGGCAGGGDVEGTGRPAAATVPLQGVEREWAQEVEREWGAASAGPRPMAAYDSNGYDGAAGAAAANPTRTTYRLNSGDVVQISVWREEELQRQALVQPDGSISFPLIGQVAAAGRTVGEVEAEIAGRLARFIPDAVATVELLEARGNKIYVMGEVNRPGEYQLGSTLTVVQAIGLAGGFTQYAATDRIRVLRKGGRGGEGGTATVDYGRIASGRDGGAADVELRAGDTVIVPEEKLFSLF